MVFTEPRSMRNSFSLNSPSRSEPITAAWLEPREGRKEHNGDARIVARDIFFIWFLFGFMSFIFGIICFGRLFSVVRLLISADEPNSPVKSGRRESFRGSRKLVMPRNPANKKIKNAFNLLSSFKTR